MSHLRTITIQRTPASARTLMEWGQVANVALAFTEVLSAIVGVWSDILGLEKGAAE
jgi:hypothetical protein